MVDTKRSVDCDLSWLKWRGIRMEGILKNGYWNVLKNIEYTGILLQVE